MWISKVNHKKHVLSWEEYCILKKHPTLGNKMSLNLSLVSVNFKNQTWIYFTEMFDNRSTTDSPKGMTFRTFMGVILHTDEMTPPPYKNHPWIYFLEMFDHRSATEWRTMIYWGGVSTGHWVSDPPQVWKCWGVGPPWEYPNHGHYSLPQIC